ncbi:UNVERIFIED_CONTAM: hypothetical protein Sradi_4028000 [Sesamum radiatum]|uniref:HAT C-terminal dimerisation domain-containing protein n=1 Tax=Sesamum radiatum TaxID=300843 RepID=A0AAW2PMQ9_SESRA
MYGNGSSNALSLKRNIEHALNDLYYHYLELYDSHTFQVTSDTPNPIIQDSEVDELGDVMKLIKSGFDKHLEQNDNMERKLELLQYLSESHEKMDDAFDILNWWKTNFSKYLILSRVARNVLATLVSTIASEQAFSTSGRLLDPYRSSLDSKTVEALICTQS